MIKNALAKITGVDIDIKSRILTIRGVQVKRNADRFPAHFMFRLSAEGLSLLRSQFATSSVSLLHVRKGMRQGF